jgi:segregation and condensation protein A
MSAVPVRDLDLDLDAFQGPFDLLLTLVLREELELADVEVAEIVLAFVERVAERAPVDLEGCGEFLVLVSSLLELKARELFPDELGVEELDPDEAAEELAERLAAYRRFRAAAGWLEERLTIEGDRYFRVGPAPLAPVPARPLAPQEPAALARALRGLAAEPPAPSLRHLALAFPPVSRFVERFRALLRRRRRFVFDAEIAGLSRVEQAVAFLALLELRKRDEVRLGQSRPFDEITVWSGTSA